MLARLEHDAVLFQVTEIWEGAIVLFYPSRKGNLSLNFSTCYFFLLWFIEIKLLVLPLDKRLVELARLCKVSRIAVIKTRSGGFDCNRRQLLGLFWLMGI